MVIRFVLISLIGVGSLSAIAEETPIRLAQVALPTLEEVIFLDSEVDQKTVYLGEEVQLTLTFGQLKFRGIRVQNFYKTSAVRLPEMEGFFSEEPQKEIHEQTRNGFAYIVTTYRINLYPTRSGKLFIGAWRWQGMARGFTSEGARSIDVDKKTDPITIEVLPLPPAPADFSGAIGAFTLQTSVAPEVQQGLPFSMQVDVYGSGNPQTLRPPQLQAAPWYRAREVPVDSVLFPEARQPEFLKRFTYELVALEAGEHTLAPLSMTFFSPTTKRYKTVESEAMTLAVAASGETEELVVVGGVGQRFPPELMAMGDGRLPVVAQLPPLDRPWLRIRYFTGLSLVPVVCFLLIWGFAFRKRRAYLAGTGSTVSRRIEVAMGEEGSVNGLRQAILQEIRYATGLKTAGMSAPELEEALARDHGPALGGTVGGVLRWCETARFSSAVPTPDETREQAQRVIGALTYLAHREDGR